LDAVFCRLNLGQSIKKYERGFGLEREHFDYPNSSLSTKIIPLISLNALQALCLSTCKKSADSFLVSSLILKQIEEMTRRGIKLMNPNTYQNHIADTFPIYFPLKKIDRKIEDVDFFTFLTMVSKCEGFASMYCSLLISIKAVDTPTFDFLITPLLKKTLWIKKETMYLRYNHSIASFEKAITSLPTGLIIQEISKKIEASALQEDFSSFETSVYLSKVNEALKEADSYLIGNSKAQIYMQNITNDVILRAWNDTKGTFVGKVIG
jgi:hypothetical protein